MKTKKQKKDDLTTGDIKKKLPGSKEIIAAEEESEKDEVTIYKSGLVSFTKVGEMIYSKVTKKGAFLIYSRITKKIKQFEKIKNGKKTFLPDIRGKLIANGIIKIPSGIEDHISTKHLISCIREYLDKYVYIENWVDKEIIISYTLLTWVYERFSAIPYLRALGEYGTGKSRLLDVLGVCYKSLRSSSNASSAPIFRLIDRFKGTFIIDEAELGGKSGRNQDIREILRFGKDKGGCILRCSPSTYEPEPFKVFGPKILGSRQTYGDDALESRIITIRMTEAKKENIPLLLDNEEFEDDAEKIRKMLLDWRLKNYFKIDTEVYKKHRNKDISDRLNEMYAPIICIRSKNKKFLKALMERAVEKNIKLLEDKAQSFPALIIEKIGDSYFRNNEYPLLKNISDIIKEETGKTYQPRFIGGIVRENLNLKTEHTHYGTVVIAKDEELKNLAKEYNISALIEDWDSHPNEEKTFQTPLSQSINNDDNSNYYGKRRRRR